MASSVDLPAPLGPISPVSVPRRTENDTSSTARTPPKSRQRPRPPARRPAATPPTRSGRDDPTAAAARRGRSARAAAAAPPEPTGAPAAAAPAVRPAAASGGAAGITRLRSGRMPCGRNHRKITISSPIATHSSDGIRFGGRLLDVGMNRVTSSNPTGTRMAPSTAPQVVARPADDHRREQHHGLGVAPGRRGPGGDVGDQDAAGQAGDGPADDQHRGPHRQQVLAERVGDHVVVAHGPQRPAVGRLGDPAARTGRRPAHKHDRDRREAPTGSRTTAG